MNNRVGIATLAVFLAGAPILALAVLTRPAPGTETATAEQPSAVAVKAATQTAAQTAPVVADAVPLAVAAAAEQPRRTTYGAGGTVTLTLQRTDTHQEVNPGDLIEWEIVAQVTANNDGLALISVDLIQSETNPELIDLDVAVRPAAMVDFDRPNGIANPDPNDPSGPGTAYGGTQIAGATGGLNLIQIGGSQNTFGVADVAVGEDIVVDSDVGFDPVVIAEGAFNAPSQTGDYTMSLQNGIANVLDDLAGAPPPGEHWPVHEATVDDVSSGSFTFTVVLP